MQWKCKDRNMCSLSNDIMHARDGVLWHSTVLEVGEELGVENSITLLNVVDFVHGVDCTDRYDGKHDGHPDCGLAASNFAVVDGVLEVWNGNVGKAVAVGLLLKRCRLSIHHVGQEEEADQKAGLVAGSHRSRINNKSN